MSTFSSRRFCSPGHRVWILSLGWKKLALADPIAPPPVGLLFTIVVLFFVLSLVQVRRVPSWKNWRAAIFFFPSDSDDCNSKNWPMANFKTVPQWDPINISLSASNWSITMLFATSIVHWNLWIFICLNFTTLHLQYISVPGLQICTRGQKTNFPSIF